MAHSIQVNIDAQIKKVKQRLNKAEALIALEIAEALAELGKEILTDSNELCPFETGELRNSGKATLSRQGGRDRTVVGYVGGASSSGGGSVYGVTVLPQSSYWWELELSYDRFKDSFDVALFTHENLNPYGSGPPAARQPGTGPKYLERAYIRNIAGFEGRLGKRLSDALQYIGYSGVER